MEQPSSLTRQQFIMLLGAGLLSIVVAKVANVESTLATANPAKNVGYGTSAYGGQH